MASEGDDLIHQLLRLKIMAALCELGAREALEFARLKRLVHTTDGNLGAHLLRLERAGYVAIEKDFVGRRPRTRAALTREGRRALLEHVAYLRGLLEKIAPRDPGHP